MRGHLAEGAGHAVDRLGQPAGKFGMTEGASGHAAECGTSLAGRCGSRVVPFGKKMPGR